MEIQELHKIYSKHSVVSTDTRNIAPNSLFFALKGENFDGNEFAAEALKQGSIFAIVDEPSVAEDDIESNGGYIALGLFILFGIPIIIIIVVVILIRRRKNAPKLPSADYGDVKILKRKIKDGAKIKKNQESKEVKPKKEDKKEETSMFCDNCGAAFKKPTAKFCGGCGTPRS